MSYEIIISHLIIIILYSSIKPQEIQCISQEGAWKKTKK